MRNKTFDHKVEKEWLQRSGVLHNETLRYLSIYFEKTANKLALEKLKCEMTIELLITKRSGEEKIAYFYRRALQNSLAKSIWHKKMPIKRNMEYFTPEHGVAVMLDDNP